MAVMLTFLSQRRCAVSRETMRLILLTTALLLVGSEADAKIKIAQLATPNQLSCLMTCDTQGGSCQSGCINSSGSVSTGLSSQNNQCILDCTRVQLVCKQSCATSFPNR
jgi:hypothetical protein